MRFFLEEILEDREAAALIQERTDLHERGRQLADYIARTRNRFPMPDGMLPLVTLAYLADYALERNTAAGIDRSVTVATLRDVNIWVENYRAQYGKCGLGKFSWLYSHYTGNLFRLGRLQFILLPADEHVPEGIFAVDTHIPQGERLDPDRCMESFAAAKKFFAKLYPGLDIRGFTCRSWLLDGALAEFLPADSNLVRFLRLWDRYPLHEEVPSILERVFGFGFEIRDLASAPEGTTLQRKLKAHLLRGGECSAMGGFLPYGRIPDAPGDGSYIKTEPKTGRRSGK